MTSTNQQLDRRDLLVNHAAGAPNAFRELIMIYRKPVYSYLVRIGIPESFRDDLFQEIFIKVHRFAGRYDDSRALAPWIFSIVANTTKSFYRKQKLKSSVEKISLSEVSGSPEQAFENKEKILKLQQAITTLPFKQKEALLLSSVQGFSYKEIAKILNVSVNTVKSLVKRARDKLHTIVEEKEELKVLNVVNK